MRNFVILLTKSCGVWILPLNESPYDCDHKVPHLQAKPHFSDIVQNYDQPGQDGQRTKLYPNLGVEQSYHKQFN